MEWPQHGEVIREGRKGTGLSSVVSGDQILVLPLIFSVILGKMLSLLWAQTFLSVTCDININLFVSLL